LNINDDGGEGDFVHPDYVDDEKDYIKYYYNRIIYQNVPNPIFIGDQQVEIVNSFTYLRTFLDESLSFCGPIDYKIV